MDSMSGCDKRFVFTFPPKDSTLQYKKCLNLWNNFPCIIVPWLTPQIVKNVFLSYLLLYMKNLLKNSFSSPLYPNLNLGS